MVLMPEACRCTSLHSSGCDVHGFYTSIVAKLTRSRLLLFDYGLLLNLQNSDTESEITFINPYQRGRMTHLYMKLMRVFVKCSLSACDKFFVYSDEMEALAYSNGLRPGRAVRYLFPVH